MKNPWCIQKTWFWVVREGKGRSTEREESVCAGNINEGAKRGRRTEESESTHYREDRRRYRVGSL